jgi:hypothetical protein
MRTAQRREHRAGLRRLPGERMGDVADQLEPQRFRLPDCKLPQNSPVLAGSTSATSGVVVAGTLASRPGQRFAIEFFASHTAGIDGLGEGEVYLGRTEVTTDASGRASFSFPTGTGRPLSDGTRSVYYTATATRLSTGQSSQFSRPSLVTGP